MSQPSLRPAEHLPLPDSYEGLFIQARSLVQADLVPDAIAAYQRLIQKLGGLSDRVLDRRPQLKNMRKQAIVELIDLLEWERRFAEAMEYQKNLLDNDPERATVWRRRLATLRIQKGETEPGLTDLRALAEEVPDDPWNWLSLGEETRLEGRFAESLAAFERAASAASVGGQAQDEKRGADALASAHYRQFLLFKDMARWDDAVKAWEEAAALKPDEVTETLPDLYKMLTEAGLYSMARTYVDRDTNSLRAGMQRGLLDLMTGKPGEAMQGWRTVAALDPLSFDSGQEAWIEATLRWGDPQPVLDRLDALLSGHGSTRVLILGGMAWAMSGKAETAGAMLQRAIDLLRRERPPKSKLDGADWRLLTELVPYADLRAALKPYFAVIETTWEQPPR
jgi:tetratricopeptide (TPR) repeat protein